MKVSTPPSRHRHALPETIPAGLARAARSKSSRTALIDSEGTISFGDFAAACRGAQAQLSDLSVPSRVAVLAENGVPFAAASFAVMCAGHVLAPIDPRMGTEDLRRSLTKLTPSMIFVQPGLHTARQESERFADSTGARVVNLDMCAVRQWLARGNIQPLPPDFRKTSPRDTAAVFGTSGTSGVAAAVLHTHNSLCASAGALQLQHRAYFGRSPLTFVRRASRLAVRYRRRILRVALGDEVWMTPISLSAIAGFSILVQCMLTGRTLVTMSRFHPRTAMQMIVRHRVTTLAATPTLIELMLRLRDFETYDTSSLLVVGLGGSLASASLIGRAQVAFGCAVAVGYGSTELGGGVLATDLLDALEPPGPAAGRPFPGVEVRVLDDAGHVAPADVQGELACKAPGMMQAYLGDGPRVIDTDGWLHTGDVAMMDAAGRVRVLGRKDDVMIRAGRKIHPAEIEDCISAVNGIRECAVVGKRNQSGDEIIVAFVCRDSGKVSATEIMAACREQLAPQKVPGMVRFVETLPRTLDGKVRRNVLRRQAALAAQANDNPQ